MFRISTALITVAALCTSPLVSAVETRENVCLNLIETQCDGDANPAVMTACIEEGVLTCTVPHHCMLASETGMCRAAFPRFAFNTATGSCEQFVYGGCGGNSNNFESENECLDSCSGVRYCGGNTEATCPKNYQCVEQQAGQAGLCVLVPSEKRAHSNNGGHNKKKKPHTSNMRTKPQKTPRAKTP